MRWSPLLELFEEILPAFSRKFYSSMDLSKALNNLLITLGLNLSKWQFWNLRFRNIFSINLRTVISYFSVSVTLAELFSQYSSDSRGLIQQSTDSFSISPFLVLAPNAVEWNSLPVWSIDLLTRTSNPLITTFHVSNWVLKMAMNKILTVNRSWYVKTRVTCCELRVTGYELKESRVEI